MNEKLKKFLIELEQLMLKYHVDFQLTQEIIDYETFIKGMDVQVALYDGEKDIGGAFISIESDQIDAWHIRKLLVEDNVK